MPTVTAACTLSVQATVTSTLVECQVLRAVLLTRAAIFADGDVLHYPTNPALSIFDFKDPTKFKLTVNSQVVDFTTNRFKMDEISVSYDTGKQLVFTEIPTPNVGDCLFDGEQWTTLEMNFGSGLEKFFSGKIRHKNVQGRNNDQAVQYTAIGIQQLAQEIEIFKPGFLPLEFTQSTTVTSAAVVTTFTDDQTFVVAPMKYLIRDVIQELFNTCGQTLVALGIPATIGTPGLEVFEGYVPENLSFRGTPFMQALQQVAGFAPGKRPFFDDIQQAWTFPDIYATKSEVLQVNSINLTEEIFDVDLADRYTAIWLVPPSNQSLDYAYQTFDIPIVHWSIGHDLIVDGKPTPIEVGCWPDWDQSLQASWTVLKGEKVDKPKTEISPYYHVFRRFGLYGELMAQYPPHPKSKFTLWQKQKVAGVDVYIGVEAELTPTFPIRVVAKDPVISRGNILVPGDAQLDLEFVQGHDVAIAKGVKLTYWPYHGTPWEDTETVTIVSATGTIVTAMRYPEEGFIGTAYTQYGIRREKVEFVSVTDITTANAIEKLRGLKDVLVSGELPVEGDPVREMFLLQRKLRVQCRSINTGLDKYSVPVVGYRYTFGKRGVNGFQLNTDLSGV